MDSIFQNARNLVIIGIVLGVVLGATIIAPRLDRPADRAAASAAGPPIETPTDVARHLQRTLLNRPTLSIKMESAFKADAPVAAGVEA